MQTDGKFFRLGGERFEFRGITYGTFRPRALDGSQFPEPARIAEDFDRMVEAGFTVVRTYTLPPDEMVAAAADRGLRLLVGAFWPDWRYLVGSSRREIRQIAGAARSNVEAAARRFAGCDTIVALSVGNEVPADTVRWVGTDRVAETLNALADSVREIDPGMLVTYANYPTTEYLSLHNMDFLTFNVFLEGRTDFRRYLNRLHHIAGDRPLVLGEIGLDSGDTPSGEARQAEVIDWQLEVALERGVGGTCLFSWTDEWFVGDSAVEGWHFGMTRTDRSPRPALTTARYRNRQTVKDLRSDWPTMSVVVCAYNAEATLDECLRHTTGLDYPGIEVVVVDDGSTDATFEIAARHSVRVVRIPHAGLSVARNEGMRAASGELVAYLDSDAYPTPQWPYYLALAFDESTVGGAGGPNVPPRDDPAGAKRIARGPGGPVHVLLTDDRAEHVPGCNMVFWKEVLEEVGGFDPIYSTAGDDIDMCWRVLDRAWEIGFHPAALVWHHRRSHTRAYLRQQRGYGRAEALVEARHPDRFTPARTARWQGHIYSSFVPRLTGQRIYRGEFGTAPFQSAYRSGSHLRDLLHQLGIPVALAVVPTACLGLVAAALVIPAAISMAFLLGLFLADAASVDPPVGESSIAFRVGVAALQMMQPVARLWGRVRHRSRARQGLFASSVSHQPVTNVKGGITVPASGSRQILAARLVAGLRNSGFRVLPSTGWEAIDARITASLLLDAELITSAFPAGVFQIRVRARVRSRSCAAAAGLLVPASMASLRMAILVVVLIGEELARGALRVRRARACANRFGESAPDAPKAAMYQPTVHPTPPVASKSSR